MKIPNWRLERAKSGGLNIHLKRKADRDFKRKDGGSNRINHEIIGKIGEEAICEITGVGEPNYEVLDKPEHDLDIPELNASVKTASSDLYSNTNDKNGKSGPSYLIPCREVLTTGEVETEDGELVDGFLFNKDAKFAFVVANQELNGEVDIYGWCHISSIRNRWKKLIYPPYKAVIKTKKAIYLDDLKPLLKPIETIVD